MWRPCLDELLKCPSLFSGQVEGAEFEELTALHESVYQQSVSWFASLQDHMKKQILSHFGSMPDREPEPQVGRPSFPRDSATSRSHVTRLIVLTDSAVLNSIVRMGRLV